ncbi:hypothetical protein [Saccharomonospora halophila]|uniref:hypothetical protein n=1 Tax=Saccharomonospora halophila TaxID=129922 RepID=UPI000369AD8D|nr:hypothetical protein [Saccharomonospora halophila]
MAPLSEMIDEQVLADAGKVDSFVREHGENLPSVENTLRLVRDIDTDRLRAVATSVWGVGGEDGAGDFGKNVESCVTELDEAVSRAASWTGEAKNAYSERIEKIKTALGDMKPPAEDVGIALREVADSWDQLFGRSVADILALIGAAVSVIGLIATVVIEVAAGWTGVGAVIGLVIGIISVLVGVASIWWTIRSNEQSKIEALETASAEAQETMTSAQGATP